MPINKFDERKNILLDRYAMHRIHTLGIVFTTLAFFALSYIGVFYAGVLLGEHLAKEKIIISYDSLKF